ncbi:MAG: porin [Candidatus Scalindua sp.]|nr:porin [Candidatus Scalindua sp.]
MRMYIVSFLFLVSLLILKPIPALSAQEKELNDLRAQLKELEEVMKSQQKIVEALKEKIESKVETSHSPYSELEEDEIEQVVDNYLMKRETRKKMMKAGLIPNFQAYWDQGLRFKSEDENFKLSVGGRIMNDWGWFDEDDDIKSTIGDQVDGTEFRRARLYMEGSIYKNIGYKIEFDYAGGNAKFTDVFMELKKIPLLGNFRVGHMKEPFSLEMMDSSKYMTFMERGLNNAFVPSRNTGFTAYNHALKKGISWSAGIFRNADAFGDSQGVSSTEGGYSFSGRLTAVPWYEDNGRKLVHAGISYSYQNAFENRVRYSSRPEMNLADKFVDTGDISAESANLFNPELAIVHGPFSFQAEYTYADIDRKGSADKDLHFSGFYAYGSYYLTGENREYKREEGAFARVKPNKNFQWGSGEGKGAVELAARYSELDLSDESIEGGRLKDITAGINWYLNPNTRVTLNYVRASVDRSIGNVRLNDDSADMLAMRFYIDF